MYASNLAGDPRPGICSEAARRLMLPRSNPTKAHRGFQSRDCGLDKGHGAQGFTHGAHTEEKQPMKYAVGVGSSGRRKKNGKSAKQV